MSKEVAIEKTKDLSLTKEQAAEIVREFTTAVGQIALTYDNQAKAAYVYLPSHSRTCGSVARTFTTGKGVLLDFNSDDVLIWC